VYQWITGLSLQSPESGWGPGFGLEGSTEAPHSQSLLSAERSRKGEAMSTDVSQGDEWMRLAVCAPHDPAS
jgi:hypothetical protein